MEKEKLISVQCGVVLMYAVRPAPNALCSGKWTVEDVVMTAEIHAIENDIDIVANRDGSLIPKLFSYAVRTWLVWRRDFPS